MSRVVQPKGVRGSLKWIQRCINKHSGSLNPPILAALPGAASISWRSPLAHDEFAEYRDGNFLALLGLSHLAPQLGDFWPRRGPQWDALGLTDRDDVLLVEAKAHIGELHSPPSAAGEKSARKIKAALAETAAAFGAPPGIVWHGKFYQLANRLAHLYFLRKHGVPAWLVLVNFLGDADMGGPAGISEWEAAYRDAHGALGIVGDTPLQHHVLHIYPEVSALI